jgi:glycosyltransferase involved in cell wall biosynthesis
MSKILLVHADRKNRWATQSRAEALKSQWVDDEVDIAERDNLPDGSNYDVIHILFSGGVAKIKDYILQHKSKVYTTLASERTLNQYFDKLEDLIEIYKNTICCVCQNPRLKEKLKSIINQDNVVYIPNGVDEQLFERKFVVGFVGAMADATDHKGLKLAQQACKELNLELRMAHSGYKSNIQPFETMPDFYRGIDCLILPSLSEGCNNPTLEALAMNKPVISTDVGIANELEGVILVERNVEGLKRALRKLSGRIQILEKYTWAKIAIRYKLLYSQYDVSKRT